MAANVPGEIGTETKDRGNTHVLPTCSHTIQEARSNQTSRDQFGRLGVFWSQKYDYNKDPCEKAQLEQPHLEGSHQVLRKRPAQA